VGPVVTEGASSGVKMVLRPGNVDCSVEAETPIRITYRKYVRNTASNSIIAVSSVIGILMLKSF